MRIIDGLAKLGEADIWPNTLAIDAIGIAGAATAADEPQSIARLASKEVRRSNFTGLLPEDCDKNIGASKCDQRSPY